MCLHTSWRHASASMHETTAVSAAAVKLRGVFNGTLLEPSVWHCWIGLVANNAVVVSAQLLPANTTLGGVVWFMALLLLRSALRLSWCHTHGWPSAGNRAGQLHGCCTCRWVQLALPALCWRGATAAAASTPESLVSAAECRYAVTGARDSQRKVCPWCEAVLQLQMVQQATLLLLTVSTNEQQCSAVPDFDLLQLIRLFEKPCGHACAFHESDTSIKCLTGSIIVLRQYCSALIYILSIRVK